MSTIYHSVNPRNRVSDDRRQSLNHPSRSIDEESQRRQVTKSSSRYRRAMSKCSSIYRMDKSTPKDKQSSQRHRCLSRDANNMVEFSESDDEMREETTTSYAFQVEESQRSDTRKVTLGRRQTNSDFWSWSKECKISEVMPDCRLRNIEARGGERDFGKWFGKLPPNCRIDKNVRTDRGVFTKDNFHSSSALDLYLGVKKSK